MKKALLLVALLSIGILGTGFAFSGESFQKDPVRIIVWLLDFRLNLSDSQEEQITQILQPVVATIRSQHQKHKTFACDLATKIGEGTLAKEDILAAMNLRQKSAKANQSMVADAILNVYKALNEEQRKTISENMKKRLANLGN